MQRLHVHLHHPNRPFLFGSPPNASPPIANRVTNPRRPAARGPLLFNAETTTGRRLSVTCMANPRRVKMVASQIHREISDMLIRDKVLQEAVMPEAAFGADDYLSSVTTISDVQVTGDLQVVKVYVSVFGDDRGKEVAMAGLKAKAKYVRSQLGKRMRLRLTPEVRFYDAEGSDRGGRVIEILDRIKAKKEKQNAENSGDQQSDLDDQDDGEWDYDDPDEDIIYVR